MTVRSGDQVFQCHEIGQGCRFWSQTASQGSNLDPASSLGKVLMATLVSSPVKCGWK